MEKENETHYDQDWIDDIAIEDYLLNKEREPNERERTTS